MCALVVLSKRRTLRITHKQGKTMKTITNKPTISDGQGIYKIVDENGLFWGHYQVGTNWCNEVYVRKIDSHEAERLDTGEYAPFYSTACYC